MPRLLTDYIHENKLSIKKLISLGYLDPSYEESYRQSVSSSGPTLDIDVLEDELSNNCQVRNGCFFGTLKNEPLSKKRSDPFDGNVGIKRFKSQMDDEDDQSLDNSNPVINNNAFVDKFHIRTVSEQDILVTDTSHPSSELIDQGLITNLSTQRNSELKQLIKSQRAPVQESHNLFCVRKIIDQTNKTNDSSNLLAAGFGGSFITQSSDFIIPSSPQIGYPNNSSITEQDSTNSYATPFTTTFNDTIESDLWVDMGSS